MSMFVRLYDPSLSVTLFESSAGTSDSEISLKWDAVESQFQYTIGQEVLSASVPEFYTLAAMYATTLSKFLE